MEKKTKACPFCWEEILETAKKCKHCGEFLEEIQQAPVEQPKKKSSIGCMGYILIFALVWFVIGLFSTKDSARNDIGNISRDYSNNTTATKTIKHYDNLNDAYNDHKNYIWNVCKEWLKLISSNQEHDFDWPTYAWEYQWKLIVKWTDHNILFRCEFVPFDNEWWMNLDDVKREY